MNALWVQVGYFGEGRYKVYIVGQPSSHIMDWRGGNYRSMPVPGQPSKGFVSPKKAEEWVKANHTEKSLSSYARNKGNGTHIPEVDYRFDKFKHIRWEAVEKK